MHKNDITSRLLAKIESANEKYALFCGKSKILIGLSGGADSVCLTLSLAALSQKYGYTVGALHVNHMIRGSEADRDEEFSRKLCEKLGIEFFSERVNIPSLCESSGKSLELCARDERYRLFEKICREHGFDTVATAHTASDNAETMIINLVRGSGIKGLCGVPPKRKLSDGSSYEVIRPLIYCERREIEEYLGTLGQDFVTDSTNLCDDCTRNRVRHEIIPMLESLNPSLVNSLNSCAAALRDDETFIEAKVKSAFTDKADALYALDLCIRGRIISEMYSRVCKKEFILEKKHIDAINSALESYAQNNFCGKSITVCLPGKISAVIYGGRIEFIRENVQKRESTAFEIQLCEGLNVIPGGYAAVFVSKDKKEPVKDAVIYNENVYKKYKTEYIYSDTIISKLCAKNRTCGEKIAANSMHKSVKRLFAEKKVPERLRSLIPFIYYENELICVPGVCVNDAFSDKTKPLYATITVYFKHDGSDFQGVM